MYPKSSNGFGDSVLSLKVGGDHIVVSQSDNYIRNLGQDLRGVRTSELKFATANSLRDLYDDCLARKRPIYARYISSLSDQNAYWETLILPLTVDEQSEPVFTMSYVSTLSEKVDVLQILYDRSPVGIVAAVPIMNGQNKTDDARILTMNEKARQILRQDPAGYPMHTVGELIRYLGDSLRWTGIATSQDGYATRIDYRNPSGDEFSMIIELVNQIVVITIAERTGPTSRPPTAFLGCSDWVERCSVDGCCRGEHDSIHKFLRPRLGEIHLCQRRMIACPREGPFVPWTAFFLARFIKFPFVSTGCDLRQQTIINFPRCGTGP